MPNGTSKVMFLDPNWRHGPPRLDLSSDLCRFGAMSKNHYFWMPSRRSNKSGKSSLEAPIGWQSCSDSSANVAFGGFVPSGRRPIIKEFQITNQTNQIDQSDERSTTPMGGRPSEFRFNRLVGGLYHGVMNVVLSISSRSFQFFVFLACLGASTARLEG